MMMGAGANGDFARPSPQGEGWSEIPCDLPCVSCGYNLRTLRRNAMCPECGAPIRDSLRLQLLHFAPREWLDRLFRGAVLTLIGFVGWSAVAGLMQAWSAHRPLNVIEWILRFAAASAIAIYLAGAWCLTTPDRRQMSSPLMTFLRVGTRAGLLPVVAFTEGARLAALNSSTALGPCMMMAVLSRWVCFSVLLLYLAWLANRMLSRFPTLLSRFCLVALAVSSIGVLLLLPWSLSAHAAYSAYAASPQGRGGAAPTAPPISVSDFLGVTAFFCMITTVAFLLGMVLLLAVLCVALRRLSKMPEPCVPDAPEQVPLESRE
jgi:hypothetical protein